MLLFRMSFIINIEKPWRFERVSMDRYSLDNFCYQLVRALRKEFSDGEIIEIRDKVYDILIQDFYDQHVQKTVSQKRQRLL